MSEQFYRIGSRTGARGRVTTLLIHGDLVPVDEWCMIHKIVPIKGRGFCEQYDLDADGLEDCEVVRLRAPGRAGIGGTDV